MTVKIIPMARCPVCRLDFMRVDWMPVRQAGICSEECAFKGYKIKPIKVGRFSEELSEFLEWLDSKISSGLPQIDERGLLPGASYIGCLMVYQWLAHQHLSRKNTKTLGSTFKPLKAWGKFLGDGIWDSIEPHEESSAVYVDALIGLIGGKSPFKDPDIPFSIWRFNEVPFFKAMGAYNEPVKVPV